MTRTELRRRRRGFDAARRVRRLRVLVAILVFFLLVVFARRGLGLTNPRVIMCAGFEARRFRRRTGFDARGAVFLRLRCLTAAVRRFFGLRLRERAAFAAALWRAEPKCNFCFKLRRLGLLRRLLDVLRFLGFETRVTREIVIRLRFSFHCFQLTEP